MDIEFLKNLPNEQFYFVNTFLASMDIDFETIIEAKDSFAANFETGAGYVFDINGDRQPISIDESLGELDVTMTQTDADYELGQGLLFDIDTEVTNIFCEFEMSQYSDFSTVLISKIFNKNTLFVDMFDYSTGTYYYRIRLTDYSTFKKTSWTGDSFSFIKQDPIYGDESSPWGLTANDSDNTWEISSGNTMSNSSNLYMVFTEGTLDPGTYWATYWYASNETDKNWIKWNRTDGKKILIKKLDVFADAYYYMVVKYLRLEGSDNGTSWTTLLLHQGYMYSNNVVTFNISNNTSYNYIRLVFDSDWYDFDEDGIGDYSNPCMIRQIRAYKEQ